MKLKLLMILLELLVSCTPKPPDIPVCERLSQRILKDNKTDHLILKPSPTCMNKINEPECGHCVYIVSSKEIYIGENPKTWFNNKPWSKIQKESILVPAQESYAPLATYLINSCEKMNCNENIQKFKVKLDSLKEIDSILNPNFNF